ncbi:MAG: hypothetical protein P8Z35_12965 [Ignavibacteriaceae bacterium]
MSSEYLKIVAVIFSLILLNGCSGEQELLSNWTDQQIKIDGKTSDWKNNLEYLKDENVAMGFKNDNKFIYICLTTNDFTKVFPMLRGGFIIWFEPEDGSKTIGIKFPIHNNSNSNQVPNSSEEVYNRRNPGEFINRMLERQNELQILNEDKQLLTDMPIKNKEGIEAKLGYHSDRFVYELKIPLSDSKYAYKLSVIPGGKLNIKFETEVPDRKIFNRERESGMRMSAGEEGERPELGGERSGRERRFGMRNNSRGSFEPLNFSVEVTLKKD